MRSPRKAFGVVFLLFLFGLASLNQAQAQPKTALPTVTVWDFDDHTAAELGKPTQLAFLKRSLSELILGALINVPGLKVVDRVHLHSVLTEQKLGSSALADQDARIQLGRLLGAQRMIFGSYTAVGEQVQVTFRLVDTATSQVMYADESFADEAQILTETQDMASRLTKALAGVATDAKKNKAQDNALWARYDAALALSDAGNFTLALAALQNILLTDPKFSPAERQISAVLEKLARQ